MSIRFEMGTINVRNGEFDHHGNIPYSQAFVAKMASVQLIEWYIMTGKEPADLADMEFNHYGHIDDLVVLTLIRVADDHQAIQALYRFATSASVLDSCGPSGYLLVFKKVQETVDRCLGIYHDVLKAAGKNSRTADLQLKRSAMEAAASSLAEEVLTKKCAPAELDLIPLPQNEVIQQEWADELRVIYIDIQDANVNIFRHAAWLYQEKGADVVIAHNHGKYHILAASPYTTDLSGLWAKLTALETNGGSWGGHAGAGGSDREQDSSLELLDVLKEVILYLNS